MWYYEVDGKSTSDHSWSGGIIYNTSPPLLPCGGGTVSGKVVSAPWCHNNYLHHRILRGKRNKKHVKLMLPIFFGYSTENKNEKPGCYRHIGRLWSLIQSLLDSTLHLWFVHYHQKYWLQVLHTLCRYFFHRIRWSHQLYRNKLWYKTPDVKKTNVKDFFIFFDFTIGR